MASRYDTEQWVKTVGLTVCVCVCAELAPYKYAGYGALLRTARLEAEAEALFARDAALLPAACELAHATLACSALNAEELCRERGLEVSVYVRTRVCTCAYFIAYMDSYMLRWVVFCVLLE